MGQIQTVIDKTKDLTIQTVTGEITAEEIINKIKEYYTGKTTSHILWDFSNASLGKISPEDIQKIVSLTKEFSHFRRDGKTAMVFSSQLGFGLGRMYDILHDVGKSKVTHKAFLDNESAMKWLANNS